MSCPEVPTIAAPGPCRATGALLIGTLKETVPPAVAAAAAATAAAAAAHLSVEVKSV
jgi:hypothetical protein